MDTSASEWIFLDLWRFINVLLIITLIRHATFMGIYHIIRRSLQRLLGEIIITTCFVKTSQVSVLTLLDLSAAFDTSITILVGRLSLWYGVASSALNWFTSYLSDIRQKVKIWDCFRRRSILHVVLLRVQSSNRYFLHCAQLHSVQLLVVII